MHPASDTILSAYTALGLALALVLASTSHAIGDTLSIPGTGSSQKLLQDLATLFQTTRPGDKITLPQTIGSTGGIRALLSGKAEMARIARPLTTQEQQQDLAFEFFAVSPVVFIAHPSVEWIDNLNKNDVYGIYSGKIRNWEYVGGPQRKIYPVSRDTGSALQAVENEVGPISDFGLPIVKPVISIVELVETVENHPFSFGFSTLSLAQNHNVKILNYNGMQPTEASVLSGQYPITLNFGIAYRQNLSELGKHFREFLYSPEARTLIRNGGAYPLR